MKREMNSPDTKTGGVYALINKKNGRMCIGEPKILEGDARRI